MTFTFSPLEINKVASDRRKVCQPIGACLLLLSPEIRSITGRMCLRKSIWYVYGVCREKTDWQRSDPPPRDKACARARNKTLPSGLCQRKIVVAVLVSFSSPWDMARSDRSVPIFH